MLIAWDNKADSAVLSASSELASLPASNIQHVHLSRKWHTAAGVKSASLTLDMGSSVSCGLLGVFGTNLTSAATLRLRGSNTDPTGVAGEKYDSGTVSAGVHDDFHAIYKAFTEAAARYWLLDLADTALPDNLQVGRLFLGPKWAPSPGQSFDWVPSVDDPSKVEESDGGQLYAEELPKKRRLAFALNWLDEPQAMDNAHKLIRAVGITKGAVVIPMENSSYVSQQSVWGRLTLRAAAIFHRYAQVWSQKFELEEIL